MLPKTVTSLAFATACLTAIASMPAYAQKMAPGSAAGTQTYQESTAPNWSQGNPGTMSGSYAPQANGGTEVITNGPQGSPPPNWSAQQNVRESQRYDRLLETNRGFREARVRKECGPITDQELHQQCLASFGQDEPLSGSSSSRRHTRSDMGR